MIKKISTVLKIKEVKEMKKVLVILMAATLLVFLMAGVALAKDPSGSGDFTYTETSTAVPSGSEYNSGTPSTNPTGGAYGASVWSYGDTYGATKTEGSYRAFDDQDNQLYQIPDALRVGTSERDSGPHGGYSTTSNKCKTCHAVHRATGTFALMRVDTPDQACEYCHVGEHRHSVVNAYWKAGTIYPANGHTIGASSEIPDSSVWQWEDKTGVQLADGTTYDVRKRHYDPKKNKIMRWTVHAGKWFRVGPISLRCQSCHQPHNAIRQVWKPAMSPEAQAKYAVAGAANPDDTTTPWGATLTWSKGYKLLRNSPSGGIASASASTSEALAAQFGGSGTDAIKSNDAKVASTVDSRLNFTQIGEFKKDPRLKVVERVTVDVRPNVVEDYLDDQGINSTDGTNYTSFQFAGGVNRTGYTLYRYHGDNLKPDGSTADKYNSTYSSMPIFETSLTFFCADCHNLNIAGKDLVPSEVGVGKYGTGMLGDRSHAVPMMITGRETATGASSGFHCYDCHNNDMPRTKDDSVKFDFNNDNIISSDESMTLTSIGGKTTCANCHISPRNYAAFKQTYRQFQGVNGGPSLSDFPHSGPSAGYKLLNSVAPQGDTWDTADTANGEASAADIMSAYTGGADALDKICLQCHGPVASRSVGYDK